MAVPTCGCPAGYTLAPDGVTCIRVTTVPPNLGLAFINVNAAPQKREYGQLGTNFYETLTSIPATGFTFPDQLKYPNNNPVNILASVSNPLWGDGTPFDGRLNTVGVAIPIINEWIGFSICINAPATQTYIIGIAANNACRIKVNGQIILLIDTGNPWVFMKWHVVPYVLLAGVNIIEVEGKNNTVPGVLGAEIYQGVTPLQLAAMTTQAQLTAVTLFSTVNKIGQNFDTSQQTSYSCPSGYAMDLCTAGAIACSLIERTPNITCCYLLTNCATLTTLTTDNNLAIYVGTVVTISQQPGCWTVSTTPVCAGAVPATVVSSFQTCTACLPTCFMLIDCNGKKTPVITNTDLTAYVGRIIKTKDCPGVCWRVHPGSVCREAVAVIVTDSFVDCATCLAPPPIPSPKLLHGRKIKPGFNTPGCTPEYTEKINCTFAEQVFNWVKKIRFGITVCCDDELQKYQIKKELLDLRAIFDPLACILPPCCAPCHVDAVLMIFNPILCPACSGLTATLQYPVPCDADTGPITAQIVFNNPLG